MKKGDIRKQQILLTAEQMFCSKGYEQTSIQDILDDLHISKGSFYHHYVSKEALLESVCSRRSENICQYVTGRIDIAEPVFRRLDKLLSGMIPLTGEKISFLLMLIPVFNIPEGRMIRISYCDSLARQFFPFVTGILAEGHQTGEIVCPDPEITCDVMLTVVNRLWCLICEKILHAEQNSCESDPGELLMIIDRCRLTIERMVSLPYGTIRLIELPALVRLCGQIHNHGLQ